MARRIVIKVGSSTLSGESGGIDAAYLDSLAEQVVRVREQGAQVVIVTSGAIVAGMGALGLDARPADMPGLQACAAVGQVALVSQYAERLGTRGAVAAQVLLTRHDTAHRDSFLHARDTFEQLLEYGAVPVVNENDTVAVDEIRFGDNDTLAALVATMVGADLVVLLSDIEGLYDADPRESDEARLLERVDELTADLLAAAGGSGSDVGTGGMATKVDAARVLMRGGVPMVICDGRRPDVVVDAVAGRPVGTVFSAGESRAGARKLWIALGSRPAGSIVIDDGARRALIDSGKSLLAAGVVGVEGTFTVGDAVVLKDRSGGVVARGLTEISSADLERVKGMRSAEIAEVLPGSGVLEVVHRDRLVLL